MSLACGPSKNTPTTTEVITQQTNRNMGLSPVFNVQTNTIPCVEAFTGPTYNISGATVPMTGLTITSEGVYNVSTVTDIDLIFNFTGSTQYTGYTGEFCYNLIPNYNGNILTTKCVNYSGITGTSLEVTTTTEEISVVDNTYTIRSWDRFISKCYTNDLGNTGTTIDTSIYTPVDTTRDHYMVTVTNPPAPILSDDPYDLFSNIQFINETLIPGTNIFQLSNSPMGGVVVLAVNGVTLATNDYTVTNDLVTIYSGFTVETTDVIQAYYNKALTNIPQQVVSLDTFAVTGITTGYTSSFSATTYENFINWNNVNNRLEVFLQDNIDISVLPTFKINGVNITYGVDFFKSNIVRNKLILTSPITINVGDVLSIYYYTSGNNTNGDLGTLNTNVPNITWTTSTNLLRSMFSYGQFTVEISDMNDPGFTTILNSGTTLYNNNIDSYSLNIGPITTNTISKYIYRVKFDKYFVDTYNNVFKTTSYSDTGYFKLNWDYINNTNF